MLRHKNIEHVCLIILAIVLLITLLFLTLAATGLIGDESAMNYEARLFDQSRVHTIDITMDDWDDFLDTATSEEYADCQITIDGEVYKNVAIRAKGNTSLSSVQQYGNNRYSFKVEFDHYQSGMTYHGLDKLSLNNLIQDNTYLKDYTAYTLMNKMDVAAPLCSFVQINVNGEPWGLYLAVEGVEDSFLTRNYGKDHGELYKPDSISFGGGRGNGREFDANKMMDQFSEQGGAELQAPQEGNMPQMPSFDEMPDMNSMPSVSPDEQMPDFENMPQPSSKGGGPAGGMGSNDVKLVYTDDHPDSYANIFNNAKTDVSEADQARLIASLKMLGEGDTSVIDTDAVLRYMTVHNFMCNDDSYTGMMIHNYYLYEENGVMEMIPWDYNLSMGGFMGSSNATSTVNTGIDNLVRNGGGDRPMADWILADETATEQYHAMYQTFMDTAFASGWFEQEFTRVIEMISPYVKDDPTAFCTYEEFENAAQTLLSFCLKRAESIQLQLSGELAKTSANQAAEKQVDASDLSLRDMGGMGGGDFPGMPSGDFPHQISDASSKSGERGFVKPQIPEASSDPVSSGPNSLEFKSESDSSAKRFMPPDMPMQKSEEPTDPTQALVLVAISIASLITAIIFAKRNKPHQ